MKKAKHVPILGAFASVLLLAGCSGDYDPHGWAKEVQKPLSEEQLADMRTRGWNQSGGPTVGGPGLN